jgi:hypothetical protein
VRFSLLFDREDGTSPVDVCVKGPEEGERVCDYVTWRSNAERLLLIMNERAPGFVDQLFHASKKSFSHSIRSLFTHSLSLTSLSVDF